ncbi:MAG: hypothetical protein BVN32_05510 [Proteobacteria bacterium ST_bin14]|nr:MAG: hypothetical protein BVN32_05510 [Proteobacteria bacterium ST_bin14]
MIFGETVTKNIVTVSANANYSEARSMGRWFTQQLSLPTSLVIAIFLSIALKYGSACFFEKPITWSALEVSYILAGCVGMTLGHLVREGKF